VLLKTTKVDKTGQSVKSFLLWKARQSFACTGTA